MNIENELNKKDQPKHQCLVEKIIMIPSDYRHGCKRKYYPVDAVPVEWRYKMRGRVGDSPVIGAGLYVDNEVGAATSTGVGEEVVRCVGSLLVVELMRQGLSPEAACRKAVERIVKKSPEKSKTIQVGFLAMNKKGEYGAYALQKGFTYAVKSATTEVVVPGKYYYQ